MDVISASSEPDGDGDCTVPVHVPMPLTEKENVYKPISPSLYTYTKYTEQKEIG